MKPEYSFFNDELALLEIRKHKWIESEKLGDEVGFATAAIDWIKKHGPAWKQYRLTEFNASTIFEERRHYRRFVRNLPFRLKIKNQELECLTLDFSLVGLSCMIPFPIEEGTAAELILKLPDFAKKEKSEMKFSSRSQKVSTPIEKVNYKVFFPFNEEIRDFLRIRSFLIADNSIK